ncbi:MAG: efflux RND transporter permease subunit, partial [Bacteroidales bacterium]
ILENITKKIEEGLPPYKAAIEGAKEMGMAISASTATTLMVFIPLIFMGGIVGIMFKQLAILTSVTMIASLITSLSLTPMISSRLLKKKNEKAERKFSFFKWSENIFVAIESAYKKLLAWVIFHKSVTILFVLAILVLSIYTGKKIGSDYIPEFDAGDVTVVFETEVGTRADATGKIGEKIASIMQDEIPERVPGSIAVIAGQTQDGILSSVGFSEGKNVGTVMCHLELPDERERSAKEIGEVLRARLEEIPEIERFHVSAGSILSAALLGNNKPIEVFLSGKHFEELNSTARSVEEYFENCGYLTDVESTIDNGKNQIEIHIDRKKASALGLNVAMVGMQVRQGIYGTDAGTLSDEGEDYDITLMYGEDFKKDITDIGNIQLTNLRGEKITLSSVADIRMGKGKLEIRRKSQQRYVVVKANLDQISLGEAAANVNQFLADFDLPEGVTAEIAGQVENKDESFGDLYLIFMLGILLVYMVMAAQFESFKHPLIIMLSVPFTAIGVIWAFAITGLTLSVTTFIGIIMLIGIVVNNGIVLVDYINQLRRKGAKLTDAVLESGSSRLRPVLMTTLTTVCAMIPMAASTGMGKEMFSPLGITIIGGLLVSTLITLLFVPAVYIAFHPNELKKEKNK